MRSRKSTLRGAEEVVLGARYEGMSVGRDVVMGVGVGVGEESDDDPFGSGASGRGVGSEGSEEEEGKEEEGEGMDVDGEISVVEEGDDEGEDEDEDIDSDEAFGEGDGERFKGFTFRGSKRVKEGKTPGEEKKNLGIGDAESEGDSLLRGSESGSSDNGTLDGSSEKDDIGDEDNSFGDDRPDLIEDDDNEDEDDEDDADEDENEDKGPSKALDDRTELRKLMAEEQKTVASTISQVTKADVEKGNAVKHQRSTFDSLLNTRIRLQKALVATNSIPALKDHSTSPNDSAAQQAILAAEEAASNLWSQLDTLRQTLTSPSQPSPKRKRSRSPDPQPLDPSTPITTLWRRMQSHESTSLPARRSTLDKWSARLRPVSALSSSRNLLTTATPTTQPLTSLLDHHLNDMSRLVGRTQTPRSCAPVQAQAGVVEAPDIYDDADFYTVLLRELVDQRMADSVATGGVSAATTGAGGGMGVGVGVGVLPRREGRVRKKVDTKASKGRKMRYTVHEKLQNFMASEDRGTWGERQRDELFGGLLGRRGALREDEEGDGSDGDGEEEGLRLFRG